MGRLLQQPQLSLFANHRLFLLLLGFLFVFFFSSPRLIISSNSNPTTRFATLLRSPSTVLVDLSRFVPFCTYLPNPLPSTYIVGGLLEGM